MLAEGDYADLYEPNQVRGRVRPFVKVGQVDLPSSIHMLANLYLHITGRLNITEWGMVGMSVQQVEGDWDVVVLPSVRYWDSALYINKVPLLAIVECKFVLFGREPLIVMEQGLYLAFGQIRMPVVHLGKNSGDVGTRHFKSLLLQSSPITSQQSSRAVCSSCQCSGSLLKAV